MKIVTEGINNAGWIGLVSVVIIIILVVAYVGREQIMSWGPIAGDQGRIALPVEPASTPEPVNLEPASESAPGIYLVYSPERLAAVPAEARAVLFFTSSRCPTCQTLERDLEANTERIPPDLYIFRVDYDTSLTLRRQYDVQAPLSFIELASGGEVVQGWTGSTSLNSILARL